mgnify:FL=1
MEINYTKSYKNHFPEFDFNEEYYIIKVNSKKFDNYWQNNSFLDESFPNKLFCTRLSSYNDILNEIKTNKNHTIAYPIIEWADKDSFKIFQGRHRIRAIIDSGAETIQLAIKEKYLEIFKDFLEVEIVNKFIFRAT